MIDDEEEAELMLGVVSGNLDDGMHARLDDIALTVPYTPIEAQCFTQFQERLTLCRRYSTSGQGSGNGEVTTTFLNQCLANARLSLLMHLRRTALRHRVNLRDDLRVFQLRLHCVFEPNTNDLHVVFDGLVCGQYAPQSAEHRRQAHLVLRAFEEAQAALHPSNSASSPPHHPLFFASLSRAQAGRSLVPVGHRQSAAGGEEGQSSDDATRMFHASMIGSEGETSRWSAGGASTAAIRYAVGMARLYSAAHHHRSARCMLFQHSTAPFAVLPLAVRQAAVAFHAPVDPFAMLESRSAFAGVHGGEAKLTDRAAVAEQAKRTGVVRRQLQALTNLASATLRNFADRVGMGPEVTVHHSSENKLSTSGRTGSVGMTAIGKRGSGAATSGSGLSKVASGDSGLGSLHHQGVHQLVHPCSRVPAERQLLLEYEDAIFITPLCYVAGAAVVRYIGRMSQHFIREAYDIYSAEELGAFHSNTDLEIHGVVRSFVRAMGGNALLSHHVQLHEVWDSDGSGCAFLCLSVTGHVARVCCESSVSVGT